MSNIKTTPTCELINIINNSKDQNEINQIAIELTTRLYVPFNGHISFENMIINFGYKPIEKEKILERRL